MNATSKGNELESQVYEWLSERLDIHGKLVRLNRHKVYHCANGRDIDVDVSIDVYASQEFMDEDRPTQTYIYECKNLSHTLDIADFDEWRGKLGDLGKTGHKLYIVCRKGFSKQTIKYAEGEHVGLIKFPYGSEVKYVLPRTIITYNNYSQSMSSLLGENEDEEIVCYDNYSFSSLSDILFNHKLPIMDKYRLEAPRYTNEHIEKVTKDILDTHHDYADILVSLLEDGAFPIVSTKTMPFDRLGYLDIPTKNIYLSSDLEVGCPRYRYVLAHEYGHYVLHRDILDSKIAVLYENDDTLKSFCASNRELRILERQANRFASYLLMPKYEFVKTVLELFHIFDIRRGYMYVDRQPCNLKDYHCVTSRLSSKFLVSKQAAAYRMIDLGLMKVNEADWLVIGI